jgi:uncharacterized lipoprotein YajG
MKLKSYILGGLCLMSLFSCSSTPQFAIVAPDVPQLSLVNHITHPIKLTLQDFRSNRYLVKLNYANNPAELMSSQAPLADVFASAFEQAMQQQGISLSDLGSPMTVKITQALIDVEQKLNDYQAHITVELMVQISKNNQTLTKTFVKNGQRSGLFSADIAVLERDFNLLAGELIANILQDPEVQQFL